MAVATDSHRDFLIPEHTGVCPTTNVITRFDDLRLFFCFIIISHLRRFFKISLSLPSFPFGNHKLVMSMGLFLFCT